MAQLKQLLNQISGLAYVTEQVKVCSPLGKSLLLQTEFQTDAQKLQTEFDAVAQHIRFIEMQPKAAHELVIGLHELNDISQTLLNLKNLHTLDDIELFEVKKFALASQNIGQLLQATNYSGIAPLDLRKVVELLDPEGSRIAHFYIYSIYDERLADLRKRITETEDDTEREQLTWECAQIEDAVRQRLTEMLHPYWETLRKNQLLLGTLDLLNAKAQMAIEWKLCRPGISTSGTRYKALFHPQMRAQMHERNIEFQAVDISLTTAPCLITGSNMSGKTVLLKSLALAQCLFQFGFFVPATEAEIALADDLFCIIDDKQNELQGLSSFAVEVLNINRIIEFIKNGKHPLVLVDELARTTNPDEGRRIVNAFVTMMERYGVMALITTHYSGLSCRCRRMRVKGLRMEQLTDAVTPQNLHRFMDYALVETTSDEVPTEALRIARIFHADEEFLSLTEEN